MHVAQQGQLEGAQAPPARYYIEDADYNSIGAVGCAHLGKGHWPALKQLNLCKQAMN
jgi:hypothetical protein